MYKLQLFAVYYKSTLTLSVGFALFLTVLSGVFLNDPIVVFGGAFMSGGTVLSLFYKEISHKNEYLFYQNMGITKVTLLATCILVNGFIGLLCIVL